MLALPLVGLLVYLSWDTIVDTWNLLFSLDLRLLAILPLLQALSYMNIAQYFRMFFKKFDSVVPYSRLFGLVFAMNFVNQILPSGGLSGITYMINSVQGQVTSGVATLAQLGRYMLSYLSYLIVMAVALVLLLTGDPVESAIYNYIIIITAASIFGIALAIYILVSRNRVDKVIGSFGRFIDWISKRFRHGKPLFGRQAIQETLNEFHDGVLLFKNRTRHLIGPWLFMIISVMCDVSVVLASFYIVGVEVNPGVILVAFVIANAAGIASVIPGDVGVHEGAMVAVLALAGVPTAQALSGTLLYRVFNKMLFLPIGFYFYSKLLKPAGVKVK